MRAAQIGQGDEDLLLTNDTGRIRLDGDEVAALIDYLVADSIYGVWVHEIADVGAPS